MVTIVTFAIFHWFGNVMYSKDCVGDIGVIDSQFLRSFPSQVLQKISGSRLSSSFKSSLLAKQGVTVLIFPSQALRLRKFLGLGLFKSSLSAEQGLTVLTFLLWALRLKRFPGASPPSNVAHQRSAENFPFIGSGTQKISGFGLSSPFKTNLSTKHRVKRGLTVLTFPSQVLRLEKDFRVLLLLQMQPVGEAPRIFPSFLALGLRRLLGLDSLPLQIQPVSKAPSGAGCEVLLFYFFLIRNYYFCMPGHDNAKTRNMILIFYSQKVLYEKMRGSFISQSHGLYGRRDCNFDIFDILFSIFFMLTFSNCRGEF